MSEEQKQEKVLIIDPKEVHADCCIPAPAHRETREQLLEKWCKLHPGQTPAVT